MNFLGMGPGELVLIATLGLIVFGPGKLPEIAAQVGRAVRDFRRNTTDLTAEFQRSFSLEEPPPAQAGSTGGFATNGAAAAETTQGEATAAATSEPPLADTSQWHWESTSSEQQTARDAHDPAPRDPPPASFWQWDSPTPPQPQLTVRGIWEWETPVPSQQAQDDGSGGRARGV